MVIGRYFTCLSMFIRIQMSVIKQIHTIVRMNLHFYSLSFVYLRCAVDGDFHIFYTSNIYSVLVLESKCGHVLTKKPVHCDDE